MASNIRRTMLRHNTRHNVGSLISCTVCLAIFGELTELASCRRQRYAALALSRPAGRGSPLTRSKISMRPVTIVLLAGRVEGDGSWRSGRAGGSDHQAECASADSRPPRCVLGWPGHPSKTTSAAIQRARSTPPHCHRGPHRRQLRTRVQLCPGRTHHHRVRARPRASPRQESSASRWCSTTPTSGNCRGWPRPAEPT